jgi:prevent-host-death family protein
MQETLATLMARKFGHFLGKVEHGSSIQILKHGRPVARLVPDCDFIDGSRAAKLFEGHLPDPVTADAIALEIAKLNEGEDRELAHGRRAVGCPCQNPLVS